MEINTLKLNKRTLNSGYIFFDNQKTAKQWKNSISQLKIGCSYVVCIKKGMKYYGFKVFYTKNHVIRLGEIMKEVLTIE